jgi:hypothetical protein
MQSEASKKAPKGRIKDQEKCGQACVVLFDERSRQESGLHSWGDGFFDFSRSLHALNSPGYVQGKFAEGFYVLSEKSRDSFPN